MKPGDHPEFFRFPPPPGTSRESTIVLDREGELWHDGERIEHGPLERALHRWLSVHPDDGRFILTNGFDWCYLTVEDTPYFVTGLDARATPPTVTLSDQSSEPLALSTVAADDAGSLFVRVKNGRFWARFARHVLADLSEMLDPEDPPRLVSGGKAFAIGHRTPDAEPALAPQ